MLDFFFNKHAGRLGNLNHLFKFTFISRMFLEPYAMCDVVGREGSGT